MRPTTYVDVLYAARALKAVPLSQRGKLCSRILQEAEAADRYTRRLGKVHPIWGRGTLAEAAAGHHLVVEFGLDDYDDFICIIQVLQHLAARSRNRHL